MGSREHVELVKRGYEAYQRGDLGTLGKIFAEDVVMTQAGRSPLAGQFKGQREVFEHFAAAGEYLGGTLRLEPVDLTASDDHVVALLHASFQRGGRVFEGTDIHVFGIRDGRVASMLAVPDDQYAFDEVLEG